jgi:SAM-dependent methyltransferase
MIDADRFNAFEREGWSSNSSDAYDRVFGPITRTVIDDLLDAAAVSRGKRVLDVATGPGYVAGRAAERGARVVGVDLSAPMLALARRALPDDVELVVADAEDLQFPAGDFDAVVANFCLLHLGRPEKAAAGFARVLRAEGRVALSVWGPPDRARLFGLFLDALRAVGASASSEIPAGPDFFRFSRDDEFERLLSGAGLREVAVRTIELDHVIANADDLWMGMLEGTVRTRALLRLQTEETRERIHREFVRSIESCRTDRGFAIPVSVKIGFGVK